MRTSFLIRSLFMAAMLLPVMAAPPTTRLVVKLNQSVTPAGLDTGVASLDTIGRAHGLSNLKKLMVGNRNQALASFGLDRYLVLEFPGNAPLDVLLDRIGRVLEVESVEPDHLGSAGAVDAPNDTWFANQWSLENTGQSAGKPGADIKAREAWSLTTGSDSIVVAVLDTGIIHAHPDFIGRLVPGYDFVNADLDPEDDHYHGTACAGIIAANANNGFGIAGIDHQAKIMPLKVLDAANRGQTTHLAEALIYAADNGAAVVSMSLINYPCNSNLLRDALGYARDAGLILVSSAGNNGIGNADTSGPGCYPEVISVGATDRNDLRASFSATGNALDIVAPGVSIPTNDSYNLGDTTRSFGGTSAAAPHIAGAVSLMLSLNPNLDHDTAKALLETAAADRTGASEFDLSGWDEHYGWGRLDLNATLEALAGPTFRNPAFNVDEANFGDQVVFSVIYTNNENLAPGALELNISEPETRALVLSRASQGHPSLIDGDYTNGERYEVAFNLNAVGTYRYVLRSSGSIIEEIYPETGQLTGPSVFAILADETATGETAGSATVSGTYLDTHASDRIEQSLTEILSKGSPKNRYSMLEHQFNFNVTAGERITFFVKARLAETPREKERFNFDYSVDGNLWTRMVSVADPFDTGYASFELPAGTAGNLLVRVTDDNRVGGTTLLDTLLIDHMFIRTEAGGACTLTPQAGFSASQTSGVGPLTVNFSDLSENNPTAWDWNFGDGTTSQEQNPIHTYSTEGTYTVTLTATNACGSNTVTRTDFITVLPVGQQTVTHVAGMTVDRIVENGRYSGMARVTVLDESGRPVEGATVYANYSGLTTGSTFGFTGADGVAVLVTGTTKKGKNTAWCFTVTDITLFETVYDATANVVTIACEP